MLPFLSKTLLFPYWLTLKIRHFLYDSGIFKETAYPVPVVCVGNITVGGTGKTPFTEMIIRHLQDKYRIAVLSRGYKRESKGFVLATENSTHREIGDEPLQIKKKFPETIVAVCEDRREGIEKLLQAEQKPDIIILDDAFQHRKVKPSHSVVLMNFNRPIFGDNLLPIGRLRDLPEELYFSTTSYGAPVPVCPNIADTRYLYTRSAIFFTGIANDSEFASYMSDKYSVEGSIKFADHCNFTKSDINKINSWAKKHPGSAIYTTEKDSKRLIGNAYLSKDVQQRLFYIPIETNIIPQSRKTLFFNQILSNL